AREWTSRRRARPQAAIDRAVEEADGVAAGVGVETASKATANEYLENLHPASGRNIATDGRRPSGPCGRVQTVAGIGYAAGGLPNDSGRDVLSRSKPGGDVIVGDSAARASIRTSPGLEADDVDQFLWLLGYHAAVFARPQYRYRRAGSSGSNQCGRD